MTLDTSQQRFGPILNLEYPAHGQSPAFSNPWSSSLNNPPTTAVACGNLFPQQPVRAPMSYGPMPVPVPSSSDIPNMNRMQTTAAAFADAAAAAAAAYPTTPSTTVNGHFAPTPTASYDAMGGYAPAPVRPSGFPAIGHEANTSRRFAPAIQQDDRRGFADAIDASHGMLAMSQETPRNIYGNRSDRSSIDSYGFPSAHSTSSSISSSSHINSYYGDSVSDYSTAGSDIENSRALPRLSGLMASHIPPAPQSMMGQFSSKISSSTQKKHKCKVCEKRFTRPSSLQTHMYSHTGEKPFACEVEGCGRHFSVVSNLRRHRKVHRGDARSDAGSEDHHSD